MAVLTPADVFVNDAQPNKTLIRQLLNQIMGTTNAPAIVKASKTALDLVTPASETAGGIVLNDPDPAQNGLYYRDASDWVRGRGFPDTFAALSNISGTANAIAADTDAAVDLADVLCLLLPAAPGTNTSGSVTLALNGAAAEDIKAASGADLAPGDIVEGVGTLLFRVGNTWRQLVSSGTGAGLDHQGDYDNGTTYTEGQVVTGSNGNWYQLTVASTSGDDPVGSGTGDWLLVLSAGGTADGSITAVKLADSASALAAMALKLGLQTDGDVDIYVDASSGNDSTGDGSIGNPFATPQRAWDSLPWLIKDRYVINIADGTYAASSRSAASMDRPALIYCDGKKLGRRTDAPGGVLTGSVVFMGESKAGVVLQPGDGDGYVRGIYVTGHVGSVGLQNMTIDAQSGAEFGIVAHRGAYVHASDIEIDGNDEMTFGVLAEAGGWLEGLGIEIHHCAIGAQSYNGGTVQLSLESDIHDCSTNGVGVDNGGYVGLTTGSGCSSQVLVLSGGRFDCTGTVSSRVTLAGTVLVRGGVMTATYTDITGVINTYPGAIVEAAAMGWSNTWTDYGADLYLPGCKSCVAPATQSAVANPMTRLGRGRLHVDATFEIRNSSGNLAAEGYGHNTYTVAADNVTLPVTLRGPVTTMQLNASSARSGTLLPTTQTGRLAGTPIPDGAVLILFGTGAAVTIVEGSSADIPGNSVTLGSASSDELMVTCVFSTTLGKWLVGKGGTR